MKYIRVVIAITLIPLVIALGWNFFTLVVTLGKNVSVSALPFWLGLGSYFIFQVVFFRPIRTYVFGHELTHALVGLLSGAAVRGFKVSSSGGSVVLSKTNIFIALAPYFVPLYTGMVIAVYWIGSRFWPLSPYYGYFLFAAGFTLAFHFSLTHFALQQGQSDLKQFGVFFSTVFILLVNFLILSVFLNVLFPREVHLRGYFTQSMEKTVSLCQATYQKGVLLCSSFQQTK